MQNRKWILSVGLSSLLLGCSFHPRESFDKALSRYRGSLVDQVNTARVGLPFFTPHTLNPIWTTDQEIVHVPDLKLTDQNGEERDKSLFQGKNTIIAFMFTSCTGFCPTLMQKLKNIEVQLKAYPGTQFVVFTVDPEFDDPAHLKAYANKMKLGSRWTLLTGERDTIYAFARETLASQAFKMPDAGSRRFTHTEHFYLMDSKGRLRAILNGMKDETPEEALRIVSQLQINPEI